jgi:hypothetical protein
MHVLCDCPIGMGIWLSTVNVNSRDHFMGSSLHDWTILNLERNLGSEEGMERSVL